MGKRCAIGRPTVFFDRDGVLNNAVVRDGKPYPPRDSGDLRIAEDAPTALADLKAAGYLLICVTNQPDIARGTRSIEEVRAMNDKILSQLPLDALKMCPHDNADNCACRKPKPGMLLEAAAEWSIPLADSWLVGDRAGDILAGRAAGCHTIFLDYHYAEPSPEERGVRPDHTCRTLTEAVRFILCNQELPHENHC